MDLMKYLRSNIAFIFKACWQVQTFRREGREDRHKILLNSIPDLPASLAVRDLATAECQNTEAACFVVGKLKPRSWQPAAAEAKLLIQTREIRSTLSRMTSPPTYVVSISNRSFLHNPAHLETISLAA